MYSGYHHLNHGSLKPWTPHSLVELHTRLFFVPSPQFLSRYPYRSITHGSRIVHLPEKTMTGLEHVYPPKASMVCQSPPGKTEGFSGAHGKQCGEWARTVDCFWGQKIAGCMETVQRRTYMVKSVRFGRWTKG